MAGFRKSSDIIGKTVTTLRHKQKGGLNSLSGYIDNMDGTRTLLSILCDSNGSPTIYTNKEKGTAFVYLNCALVKKDNNSQGRGGYRK